MKALIIPKENFGKILNDIEILIQDIKNIPLVEDEIAKKRISEIEASPSIGKSEEELDQYLQKRGVKIDRVDCQRTSRIFENILFHHSMNGGQGVE